jgi:hypothetical protein
MVSIAEATHLRQSAIGRGLAFIYSSACHPDNFRLYAADYLCCFCCIAGTSDDSDLRKLARVMGTERVRAWQRQRSRLPTQLDAEHLCDLIFGCDAAERLGVRDSQFKGRLREAAGNFSSRDLLFFDPATEAPAIDLPADCKCGTINPRGRRKCSHCNRRLRMQSVYWVWFVALTRSYTAQRLGIRLGAPCVQVFKWLPAMRPYPAPSENGDGLDFYWAIYAVTHLVYVLNDFSAYRLSPSWLPEEYEFLKSNVHHAIETNDPETTGEFLDSLKSFGLSDQHPAIRAGTNYLLASQNEDGSWGDPDAEDVYERYHPTWTAIDGLRAYRWRGERLSLQRFKPFLR